MEQKQQETDIEIIMGEEAVAPLREREEHRENRVDSVGGKDHFQDIPIVEKIGT